MAYIYAIWRLVSECITGLKVDTFRRLYVVLHIYVTALLSCIEISSSSDVVLRS